MISRYANLAVAAVVFAGLSGGLAGAATCTATNGMCQTTIMSLPATVMGTLPDQGTALWINFTLLSTSNLSIWTTSYGGGTNLDGTTASAGGFEPNLLLYNDSTGMFEANSTGYAPPNANADPSTGLKGDAYLTDSNAAAGDYTLAVTDFWLQQSTSATSLSSGFINLGNGTTFMDAQQNVRNGNYAVNISATPLSSGGGGPTSAVPEPATLFLILPAFVLALLLRKRIANLAH